jgi:hypothetical protein
MYIPKDNDMLYSMVNMKLRDQYESLEEFCDCEDVDPASLIVRLNAAGYEYDEEHNKFTPIPEPAEKINKAEAEETPTIN